MPQTIADVEFALSDSEHPADWEQPELNGQDQDEQVPEPKARYGVASNPEDAHELIDYRPTMPRRQYAEWYADRERERKRDDGELQRVRERAHEHFRDRTVVQKRLPEIEMRDATEPREVLLGEGLIQAIHVPDRGDLLCRDVLHPEYDAAAGMARRG